jgi:Lon protease-like protein
MLEDYSVFTDPIPVFPLPNVVLFPGAALPMQVFEPRYLAMTRDALAGHQLIAIALLRPGFEPYYYTNSAEVYPVVGVGRIRDHVQIPDGRYLVNLLGQCPATIQYEDQNGQYRSAMLDPVIRTTSGIDSDGEFAARVAIGRLLDETVFEPYDGTARLRRMIDSAASLDDIVDLTAACLLPNEAIEIQQCLLSETDPLRRSDMLIGELRTLKKLLISREQNQGDWPRFGSNN